MVHFLIHLQVKGPNRNKKPAIEYLQLANLDTSFIGSCSNSRSHPKLVMPKTY